MSDKSGHLILLVVVGVFVAVFVVLALLIGGVRSCASSFHEDNYAQAVKKAKTARCFCAVVTCPRQKDVPICGLNLSCAHCSNGLKCMSQYPRLLVGTFAKQCSVYSVQGPELPGSCDTTYLDKHLNTLKAKAEQVK